MFSKSRQASQHRTIALASICSFREGRGFNKKLFVPPRPWRPHKPLECFATVGTCYLILLSSGHDPASQEPCRRCHLLPKACLLPLSLKLPNATICGPWSDSVDEKPPYLDTNIRHRSIFAMTRAPMLCGHNKTFRSPATRQTQPHHPHRATCTARLHLSATRIAQSMSSKMAHRQVQAQTQPKRKQNDRPRIASRKWRSTGLRSIDTT